MARSRQPAKLIFLGTALVYLALLAPGMPDLDANSMFAMADSLVDHGGFDVSCSVGVRGRSGECYSPWYPLLPILALPAVLIGGGLSSVFGLPEAALERVAALTVPALAAAGAGSFTALLALRYGASAKQATLAAIAFAFATEAIVYARSFFAETLTAFLLAFGIWGVTAETEGKTRRIFGLVSMTLAVLAKPQTVIAVGTVGLVIGLKDRRLRSFTPMASAALGLGIYAVYNWLRFADPLTFQGPLGRQLSPLHVPIGITTLLASPGRGLFVFSPIAVAGVFGLYKARKSRLGTASIAACAGLLLAYAMHTGRGSDWGDRFFVPALPLLCAPLVLLRGRLTRVAIALGVAGALIQVPATASFWQRYYLEQAAKGVSSGQLVWSVTRTPLIGAWGSMSRQFADAAQTDVEDVIEKSGEPTADVEESGLMRTVPHWWWFLPSVGISRWLGGAASFIAILIAAFCLFVAARSKPIL